MKKYKKVTVVAKNAPCGSYAAGCPEHTHYATDSTKIVYPDGSAHYGTCSMCEVAS